MKRNPDPAHAPRTFVIRVLADGDAALTKIHGQISEPTGEDDWQATFASGDELWTLMQGRLGLRRKNSHSNSKIRPHTTGRTHA